MSDFWLNSTHLTVICVYIGQKLILRVSCELPMSKDIQIGIPCVYDALCFWAGIGFAVFVFGLIGAVFFSVLRERHLQQKKREQRRSKRKAKSQS